MNARTKDRITPRQVERYLKISKVQLHYWEKLMDLTPIEKTRGRGTPTIYSRENLFTLLLCQRLFQQLGLRLPLAAKLVRTLTRGARVHSVMGMPSVTFCVSPSNKAEMPRNALASVQSRYGRHVALPRYAQVDEGMVGVIEVQLEDLKAKAYGSVA